MSWMEEAARRAEGRLEAAGITLTLGGEPTLVPLEPEGLEWSVAADGPTKLPVARALAAAIQQRTWPGSTLLYCSGKRYEGEVNPRWALRLITGRHGAPIAPWPTPAATGAALTAPAGVPWLQRLGERLGVALAPLRLLDERDPERAVWAVPLTWDEEEGWSSGCWELPLEQRRLTAAPGPAGLRLPLEHFPDDLPCQLLTLEIGPGGFGAAGWGLFLPPLERQPTEQLLQAISAEASCPLTAAALAEPDLSGLLPVDASEGWEVLGLTADPGVLEVNLPVCDSWSAYRDWLRLIEAAGAAVGLRSWKQSEAGGQQGTGGGNHLLWGSRDLEQHPFFPRPEWLVGILRYFQHHPSLAYLFSGASVGPSSQAPRPDEALGELFDLELAYTVLERARGEQRQLIGETLRHLHADRSGNNHRSEISLDKFWNPGAPAGCLGLIEFRALESMPQADWMAAIALLWTHLAALQLDPARRPRRLHPWGGALHDRMLLPSQLWADLEAVLADLEAAGLPLDAAPYRTIWEWRYPPLLRWRDAAAPGAPELTLRPALEPWPLICDTPREGGFTSRFVDGSLRRFELLGAGALAEHYALVLNGRPLPLQQPGPLAVRYRASALYPCFHPGIEPEMPLVLQLVPLPGSRAGEGLGPWPLAQWELEPEALRFAPVEPTPLAWPLAAPWQTGAERPCTVDLRLAP
ncbi:transglutaminase family protein [Cyanobium sp. LEGE 06113]|nr:transglutaminase family protein [Cyanobium sp. LEGE 06113]